MAKGTGGAEERPELIIALVCPLGAPIHALENAIRDELKTYGYRSELIHVSKLLERLTFWTPEADEREETRIVHRQSKAFQFRVKGGPDALARAAIAAIRERRMQINGSGDPDEPADGCAYIVRQLKHPREIELLRRVYGQSAIVIAGHAPEAIRVATLADTIAQKEGKASSKDFEHRAEKLIYIDSKEDDQPDDDDGKLGQNTRDTYPLADFFVSLAKGDAEGVTRFFQLLFGHPLRSPTPEEMAMHQASSISLRSSDERRQVGAVIVTRGKRSDTTIMDIDIVASGMNEVPRREGGFYWEGEFLDARDQALRRSSPVDREDRIKADFIREIAAKLKNKKWLATEYAALEEVPLADRLRELLKRTQLMDISEFMRQVHAEMAALVDAAKRGVAVRGGEMFVTTFPCHNCAKHIIAAGITKVVYLEPYPKSRADMLHKEELALDPVDGRTVGDKVLFVPFAGVAPRQYAHLFSMAKRGKKNGLPLDQWNDKRSTLPPRYVFENAAEAYIFTEREELDRLPAEYQWDRKVLTPSSS